MTNKFFRVVLVGLICAVFGCKTSHLYNFSWGNASTCGGQVTLHFTGTDQPLGDNDRITANPYYLTVCFSSVAMNWDRVSISNLKIKGVKDHTVYELSDSKRKFIGIESKSPREAVFIYNDLELTHQGYEISGRLEVLNGNSIIDQGDFRITLEEDYEKKRSTNFIDGVLGI